MIFRATFAERYIDGESWVCASHAREHARPTADIPPRWPCDRCVLAAYQADVRPGAWLRVVEEVEAAGLSWT